MAATASDRLVEQWLGSLGLSLYVEAFRDNGYDELEICKRISFEDLDAIGIVDARHRGLLLQSVDRLRREGVSSIYFTLEPAESLASSGGAAGFCDSSGTSNYARSVSNELACAPRGQCAGEKVQSVQQQPPLPPPPPLPLGPPPATSGTAVSVTVISGGHFRKILSPAVRNGGHTCSSIPILTRAVSPKTACRSRASDVSSAAGVECHRGFKEVDRILMTEPSQPPLPSPLVLLPQKAPRCGRHGTAVITADKRRPGVPKQSSFLRAVTSLLFGKSKRSEDRTHSVPTVEAGNGAANSSRSCANDCKRSGAQEVALRRSNAPGGEVHHVVGSPRACQLLPNASTASGSDATSREAEPVAGRRHKVETANVGGPIDSQVTHGPETLHHRTCRLPEAVECGGGVRRQEASAPARGSSRQAAAITSSPRVGRRPASADVTALLMRLPPAPLPVPNLAASPAPCSERGRHCFTASGHEQWHAVINAGRGCPSCGRCSPAFGFDSSVAVGLPPRPLFFTPQVSRRSFAQQQQLQQSRQPAAFCRELACAHHPSTARLNAVPRAPAESSSRSRGDAISIGWPSAPSGVSKTIMCDASTSYHSDFCSVAVGDQS